MHFIPPGELWRNGYVESFNSRIFYERLNINSFWSLAQARVSSATGNTTTTTAADTPRWETNPCTHQCTAFVSRGPVHGLPSIDLSGLSRRTPLGRLDRALDPFKRGCHIADVASSPQFAKQKLDEPRHAIIFYSERFRHVGPRMRRVKLIVPVVDWCVTDKHFEAELTTRFARRDPARCPVGWADFVASDMAAEADADGRAGCAVKPFSIECLWGEASDVANIGYQPPDVLG